MAGKWEFSLISRIQQANDIVDVISEHLSLEKRGKELVGLCPFHADHKPSLYVSPAKQIFKCFACGAGGDVLKFVQMKENLTFPQSVERLAERAGIRIEPLRKRNVGASGSLLMLSRWQSLILGNGTLGFEPASSGKGNSGADVLDRA
ncbi:MAG TPA: CHC2 zinc finger domain-containing protein [Anaerohalosphaeraceae bacterium]|nr:CHC2 zinc finger domain-containing protein [Anaerohalosphaeraceae bacterium]